MAIWISDEWTEKLVFSTRRTLMFSKESNYVKTVVVSGCVNLEGGGE